MKPLNLLDCFPSLTMLIVGDVCTDVFIPADRGRDIEGRSTVDVHGSATVRQGMARFVANQVESLGARSILVSCNESRIIRYGSEFAVRVPAEQPTPCEEEDIIARIVRGAAQANGIIVSDYGKGVCTNRVLRAIAHIARDRSLPVVVDPSRKRPWADYRCNCIKANMKEFHPRFMASIEPSVMTIVTDGSRGMFIGPRFALVDRRHSFSPFVDAIGCGDVVAAVIGLAYAAHWKVPGDVDERKLWHACDLANAVAAMKTTRHGCEPVAADRVRQHFLGLK